MYQQVKSFPNINPLNYVRWRRHWDPILSCDSFYNYASGRSAIYHAMLHCGLPADSEILMPSFHCGVEVEAVLRAGYRVVYYNVLGNLKIDFEDLEKRISGSTRALFVIHYFGFPQDMERVQQLCKMQDLMLLEDCAHSLYSQYKGQWLGTFGAYGFYSTQKMIALPNGGCLLCNLKDAEQPLLGKRFLNLALVKKSVKSMLEFVAARQSRLSQFLLQRFDRQAETSEASPVGAEDVDTSAYYDVPIYDYENDICALSKPLLRKERYTDIIDKRISNYLQLREKICDSPQASLFEYQQGVCPLCLVAAVVDRDRVEQEMNRAGVFPFIFGKNPHPSFPIDDFPGAGYLRDKLIGLPVHQQLTGSDINKVANVFNQVLSPS